MKLPFLESLVLKCEVGGALAFGYILAIIPPDKELIVMGWSVMGAILGGFVGVSLSQPVTFKDWAVRWGTNIAAGIITGLVVTAKYESEYSYIPLNYFAMFCAAVCGPLTVLALPVGIPFVKKWIKNKFKKLSDG